jgi:hypothetical protein
MIYELRIHEGLPQKEGYFLYFTKHTWGIDIDTFSFIPGYGWNAYRNIDGSIDDGFTEPFKEDKAYIGWAELSALTTVEILQDIRDEVEKLRETDPANRGEDYCSESEMWHYNNVDELADHLEQAIGYAKELKGDLY